MTRTESNERRQTYEPSGDELRIYWDEQTVTRQDIDGNTYTVYTYWEAVTPISATAPQIAAAVAEIDPDADAEALAQGWFDSELPWLLPLRFRTLAVPVEYAQLAHTISDAVGYTGEWSDASDAQGAVTYTMTAGWMPLDMVWESAETVATDSGQDPAEVAQMLEVSDISDDAPLRVCQRIGARPKGEE